MAILLPILIAVHLLSGVFWAGSTFVLARTSAANMETLARPQVGSAAVAVLAGFILWNFTHGSNFGPSEFVLAAGVAGALLALGLQISVLPTVRRMGVASQEEKSKIRSRLAIVQRIAAFCLMACVACMAVARYVY